VTADAALIVEGLVAGYAGRPVLRGVDLTVPAGRVAAVLGASGCGKTTLLRAIAGFHPVDGGTIRFGGRLMAGDGVDVAPERRRVGLVPQEGALFGHLTVAGNVGFGLDRAARKGDRVDEVLELVGLAGYGSRRPDELSGGQQQRVALARALAPEPALVLFDEPFTALDAGLRAEVREQVRAALRAAGATAVLVTHDQQEALGVADLVAVLAGGRVLQSGPPRTVYGSPVDIGVGAFLGEAVVLPATVRRGRATTLLGELRVDGPDGVGHVMLRPEQIRIATGAAPTATVAEVIFHGHDSTILLRVDADGRPGAGELVRCRIADPAAPELGDRVAVRVAGTARFFPG